MKVFWADYIFDRYKTKINKKTKTNKQTKKTKQIADMKNCRLASWHLLLLNLASSRQFSGAKIDLFDT